MNTFDQLFTTNEDGVEIFMGTNSKGGDIFFTIAESGNEKHEKSQRKYAKQLETARKNPKKEHYLMAKIMAEAIVTNWRGVLDDDGNELAPDMENKIDAFNRYKKLFFAVLKEANNEENFIDIDDLSVEEINEDTEGNSGKS
jgi:hypothetical protein